MWGKDVVLQGVNDNRNRRRNKFLPKMLVQRTRPKRHFHFRSAR